MNDETRTDRGAILITVLLCTMLGFAMGICFTMGILCIWDYIKP